MADPISSAAAAGIYKNVQQGLAGGSTGATGGSKAGGSAFGDLLEKAASDSLDTMHAGEKASAQAVTGKANLTDVVDSITDAELTLQTVIAVRDKMLQSYQDILRMPI